MNPYKHRPIPSRDPITNKPLIVTELQTEDGDVTIRSKFALPRVLNLDEEQFHFLETFLRCRGVISSVEKELGISYPTVRGRLDALLASLDLSPIRQPERVNREEKVRVLEMLERGEITAEEAKTRLKEAR